ncbi:MAG: acyl-CoA reductase [Putridiphycobacter sp.]|nr:acyl-CoA reductase [Putridiphycobacter sp.]
MKTNQRIELLSAFGIVLDDICHAREYIDAKQNISEHNYQRFTDTIERVHIYNGWFTKENVLSALNGIKQWLTKEELSQWLANYQISDQSPKTIGLIMAGNIPLVGFHDFLAVFLSGHQAQIKLSSDDAVLWPIIIDILNEIDPQFLITTELVEKLAGFDAVIATGSNNSANYFEAYFGKYPHIIRKNRTSIAILKGDESQEELQELGKDIFSYFGLGCRNVTQLLVPVNYDLNLFFESIYVYNDIINHHKYANNYDYNKAIYLLNSEDLLDNNFLLVRRSSELHSPIGVLFRHEYESEEDIKNYLKLHEASIQAVIGKNFIPFGKSQSPSLMDYADGVDTMAFLTGLK